MKTILFFLDLISGSKRLNINLKLRHNTEIKYHRSIVIMSQLEQIPSVDIDSSGRFKYILIKLSLKGAEKYIVRGYAWAEYHGLIC